MGGLISNGEEETYKKVKTPEKSYVVKDRGSWGKHLDFMLSCIGYAVGLGNIWRFPYLCYRNGGGAFLIPYFTMMLLAGMPLMFLELAFGQYAGEGPITIWGACPIFAGIGLAMVVISGLVAVYYNIVMAWSVYFFLKSFAWELPWKNCGNEWNTMQCGYEQDDGMYVNGTWFNQSHLDMMNISRPKGDLRTPAQEFWSRYVLEEDGHDIENIGYVKWQLALCLLLAWIVVYACICKGIKTSGKVVYFSATFPYIILTALVIRGVTLEGAGTGIHYYLSPKWELLKKSTVWNDAAVQIFYSVGPAWGGVLTMASYNKFHNNCLRDAIVVPIINCLTSFYTGFAVFSVLGFISLKTGIDISKLPVNGPGLVFITYPEALARMPAGPVWSLMFFFMLFLVGLDTQFGMVETVISGLVDLFPSVLRKHKTLFAGFICSLFYLIGLPLTTAGGIYWFELINWYSCWISLMFVGCLECIAITWCYGIQKFMGNIKEMLGSFPFLLPLYAICWIIITPGLILFISLFALFQYVPVYYGDYVYPGWAELVGWIIASFSLMMPPLSAILLIIFKAKGSFIGRVRFLMKPSPNWGRQKTLDQVEEIHHGRMSHDSDTKL